MNGFELNTTIANLRDLRASDLTDYDGVYLGDIYCRLYESNFLEQLDDLKEGLHILHDQGKRAYVTTYAAPRTCAGSGRCGSRRTTSSAWTRSTRSRRPVARPWSSCSTARCPWASRTIAFCWITRRSGVSSAPTSARRSCS